MDVAQLITSAKPSKQVELGNGYTATIRPLTIAELNEVRGIAWGAIDITGSFAPHNNNPQATINAGKLAQVLGEQQLKILQYGLSVNKNYTLDEIKQLVLPQEIADKLVDEILKISNAQRELVQPFRLF